MTSNEASPPELGGETVEDTSSQIPQAPLETSDSLRSVATQLLQQPSEAAEDTDGHESPDCQVLLSALGSLRKKYPNLDFSKHGKALVDEILNSVDSKTVPELIHAVAGVDALSRRGLSTSNIALHAAKLKLSTSGS